MQSGACKVGGGCFRHGRPQSLRRTVVVRMKGRVQEGFWVCRYLGGRR